MKTHLCTVPPDRLKIVVEFLDKEGIAYTTQAETERLGHSNLPSGNFKVFAQSMDVMQQMRYVAEVVPYLMG